jgi:aspartate/tyrosine/aromatic aminotransferase
VKLYDRTEHFKRFQNLKEIIKELSKNGWVIIHKKPNYTGLSLNTKYKKEIIEFIEKEMPYLKGAIK